MQMTQLRVLGALTALALAAAAIPARAGRAPRCSESVTAGGFVVLTVPPGDGEFPNNNGNFGASGFVTDGKFSGSLNYIDHQTGMHVQGTGVTSLSCVDKFTREIRGTCKIDGRRGFTYTLTLRDMGEPGVDDHFCLTLSTGYVAGGLLRGGNVQLHGSCLTGAACQLDPPVTPLCGTGLPDDL